MPEQPIEIGQWTAWHEFTEQDGTKHYSIQAINKEWASTNPGWSAPEELREAIKKIPGARLEYGDTYKGHMMLTIEPTEF